MATNRVSSKPYCVQYGCGLTAPPSWHNFDAAPILWIRRIPVAGKILNSMYPISFPRHVQYGNIVRGLPVQSQVDAVFASHVLEHLSLKDFYLAIKNTYQIMKQKAVFRLIVPDLEIYAKRYLDSTHTEAAIVFMKETLLGYETRERGVTGFLRGWLGNSRHLWMWDDKSIQSELLKVGFSEVRRAHYHDSIFSCFREVEYEDRTKDAVIIEAIK